MKIDEGLQGECKAIIERETSRIQTLVDNIKSMLSSMSMTIADLQKLVTRHTDAVKQTYAQLHANYHNQFDDSCFEGECGDTCVFCIAEQRFDEVMTKIIASITETHVLTADEINALALKHGVTIH